MDRRTLERVYACALLVPALMPRRKSPYIVAVSHHRFPRTTCPGHVLTTRPLDL
eukprot:SAG22_NODE_15443_length_348_cov_1.618474_1_plen_53_part_01